MVLVEKVSVKIGTGEFVLDPMPGAEEAARLIAEILVASRPRRTKIHQAVDALPESALSEALDEIPRLGSHWAAIDRIRAAKPSEI